ncbi:MAG: 6-carboxytetrahydropterin synthase [Bacteroidales bacterium]|nr:6-carboxytetrahydropterin synthase [Bacteroidales bacterium]
MSSYISTKIFDGFSTVFRQWRAVDTHCSYLHGYDVYFKVWFEGALDEKNWVWDFGGMKRTKHTIDGMNPKEWMEYMFDHTVIIAADDPEIESFKALNSKKVIQLRIVETVGAERFAELIYNKLQPFIQTATEGRVRIKQIEFFEHSKNSAIYIPSQS